jgi:glycerophosphoryl diester phosphodiesterase
MTTRKLIALGAAALTLAAAAPATAKTPFAGIQAHRGGAMQNGTPVQPENSLEAFKNAHDNIHADVIEMDAKLTADNVPVIMHDATLDRTTNCTGPVRQRTAADLAANCRIDTIGAEANVKPATGPGVAIPTLASVLAWAKTDKVKLSIEIKNQPTDSEDYDATPAFATAVLDTIDQSGIDKKLVLIQSFWPPNLDVAKARGFQTILLLLQQGANQQGIDLAKQYGAVSPGWPTAQDPKTFVENAHAAGLPVIPYTIDDAKEIDRALAVGSDAVITNDPALGTVVRDARLCKAAVTSEKRLKKVYNKRLKAYRAKPTKARKKAMLSARKVYTRASRARKATCTAAER